ncbi:MAG: hypothetical protein ABSA45_12755 [Verrucomicrobiota bacterium]|jgi:hypothetical protein
MKLTKTLMCAMAVGAMAFATDQAQAANLVIDGNLYVPLNIKGTFSYVASAGVIKQKTATSKEVISKLGFAKGIMLAIGPGTGANNADVYAISNSIVITNLTLGGYFRFSTSDTIDTTTGNFPTTKGTYSEAGVVTLDFASSHNLVTLSANAIAFNLTGTYTLKESDSAVVGGLFKEAVKFSSKNLGGLSFVTEVDQTMPVSGSASGSGGGGGVVD